MRLAVSNIAWAREDDDAAARALKRAGVDAVELAPAKYFSDPPNASAAEIATVQTFWQGHGLPIVAMQALLFAAPDLKLFGSDDERATLAHYLSGVLRVGAQLGAKVFVFGSPKNRRRDSLDGARAFAIAKEFFLSVGSAASILGVSLCIEANPAEYGADFILSTAEAAELVEAVGSPGFGLHLDLGGMQLRGDDILASVRRYASTMKHIHLSAPHLESLANNVKSNDRGIDYRAVLDLLDTLRFSGYASVEMKPSPTLGAADHLRTALAVLRSTP